MTSRAAWLASLALVLSTGARSWALQEPEEPQDGAPEKPAAKAQKPAAKKSVEPAAPDAEPAFKVAKAKETFARGRELFEAEKYREAIAEFAKVKGQTKGDADKKALERWTTASQGGQELAAYRQAADRGALRASLFKAMDGIEKYRGSPIAPKYEVFVQELLPRAAVVLETFDIPGDRYKLGKEFIDDPSIVFRGSHCLLWTNSKEGNASQLVLPKGSVPKSWTSISSVVFWARFEHPVEMKVIAMSPQGGAKKNEDPNVMEYSLVPQPKAGWTRIEMPLDQFKKHSNGTFANVEKFLFQVDGKAAFKFYLDDVILLRKEQNDQSSSDKDSKDSKSKKGTRTSAGKSKQTQRTE